MNTIIHIQVSISGLFDMSAMMDHIAGQYIHTYGSANTRVTVRNYRKFKVLETLTAPGNTATADLTNGTACACAAATTGVPTAAAAATAAVGVAPISGSIDTLGQSPVDTSPAGPALACTSSCSGSSSGRSGSSAGCSSSRSGRSGSSSGCSSAPGSPGRGGAGGGVVGVKAKDLAKMTHPIAFHEALTLPFTGDSSVEAYYERIDNIMSPHTEAVCVVYLCVCGGLCERFEGCFFCV